MPRKKSKKIAGVGLIEALISIFVVSTLIFLYSNISYFLDLASYTKNKIHAYELAQEEMESLRNLDFGKLTNRTEDDFLNVAYNQGDWHIIQEGTDNVFELLSPGSQSGVTGIAIVPGGDYDDFVLEFDVKALPDSNPTWQAGVYFRYQDKNNYYRLTYNASSLSVVKVVNGQPPETLISATGTSAGTWVQLQVIANGSELTAKREGSPLGTATDTAFTTGKIALMGLNSVHAYFDDVGVDEPTEAFPDLVTNGDFEGEVTAQNTPEGWQRLGLNDLPTGTGKLTIADYEGNAETKEITAKVEWKEKNNTRSVQLKSIISKYGVHKK